MPLGDVQTTTSSVIICPCLGLLDLGCGGVSQLQTPPARCVAVLAVQYQQEGRRTCRQGFPRTRVWRRQPPLLIESVLCRSGHHHSGGGGLE